MDMVGPAQPRSHQFEWVLKPKDEEIVYNNELMLSFPSSFNWKSTGTGSAFSHKRNNQYLLKSAPLTAKDHIIAERKRRENISQRLIALSAIIPGLKKVLYDINYSLFYLNYCLNIYNYSVTHVLNVINFV